MWDWLYTIQQLNWSNPLVQVRLKGQCHKKSMCFTSYTVSCCFRPKPMVRELVFTLLRFFGQELWFFKIVPYNISFCVLISRTCFDLAYHFRMRHCKSVCFMPGHDLPVSVTPPLWSAARQYLALQQSEPILSMRNERWRESSSVRGQCTLGMADMGLYSLFFKAPIVSYLRFFLLVHTN